jgi:hypothetical protein
VGCIKINTLLLVLSAAVVAIVALILYFRIRDSPGNNLRWARKHHALGEKHYEKGELEKSRLHYEIARQHREKALKGES